MFCSILTLLTCDNSLSLLKSCNLTKANVAQCVISFADLMINIKFPFLIFVGDLLLLHDTSVSMLQEKIRNEGSSSPSQLWSSTSLHKSVLNQLFQLIATDDLRFLFQSVFQSSIVNNIKNDDDCNYYNRDGQKLTKIADTAEGGKFICKNVNLSGINLYEKFRKNLDHYMKPISWMTTANNNSNNDYNSNSNNINVREVNDIIHDDCNRIDLSGNGYYDYVGRRNEENYVDRGRDKGRDGGRDGGDCSVGWGLLSSLLHSLEIARKMTTSISIHENPVLNGVVHNNNSKSNLPTNMNRNKIHHENNYRNDSKMYEINHNNLSQISSYDLNKVKLSDPLAKVIIILFLVKRVSIPLLLEVQIKLF